MVRVPCMYTRLLILFGIPLLLSLMEYSEPTPRRLVPWALRARSDRLGSMPSRSSDDDDTC